VQYRAYVCCGPNCGPKDSRALLDLLVREVERAGLAGRVSVLPTGCQNHCESGPTMVVYPGPVFYQQVSRERLHRIVQEHFGEHRPVEEYFWAGPRFDRRQIKLPLDFGSLGGGGAE
jgi:(2Fe-2S) ferredoxin